MTDKLPNFMIDTLFKENPDLLIEHQVESYNDFFDKGINKIFKEKNPIRIMKNQDSKTGNFLLQCNLYLGGKNGDKVYYGKPIIFDDNREHFMFPNEARLRNMTYGITIHYDVEVEYFITNEGDDVSEKPSKVEELSRIFLGRFPIMLMSNLCVLKGLDPQVRFEMGECKNEPGGYFILDGKEKCIVSQEKFADNMLYIRENISDLYSLSADIRSVSEDTSKPIRSLSIKMIAPGLEYSNENIVVVLPNVRKPIPLFITMRALGIISDKDIIETCLLDLEDNVDFIDHFRPSIHDNGEIFTQEIALKYIATFTKGKSVAHTLEILTDYFLPHIGEMNFKDKAYFLGYMVLEMLKVKLKQNKPTDRDSFRFKRVETPGYLISELFNEYYTLQLRDIYKKIDKEYYYRNTQYQSDFTILIQSNYKEFFKDKIVEKGIRDGFKGNWGSNANTKRLGIVQGLNRLSHNSMLSHLRKLNLPLDASAKVIGPRLLHGSQWGIIDPLDTPDGGNVGLHKHLSIGAKITSGFSCKNIIELLNVLGLKKLSNITKKNIYTFCKIFVNGSWVGMIEDPIQLSNTLKLYRRTSMIPIYTSILWNIQKNEMHICTDSGRLCRPLYYIENGEVSHGPIEDFFHKKYSWIDLVTGKGKKVKGFNYKDNKVYFDSSDLFIKGNELSQCVVEYLDTSESESSYIAMEPEDINEKHTHLEIHPSLSLGVMGNQIIFPENNPLPRDLFACGQMKQAVSLYHSNFQNRIDKMGVVLNYGEIPLVKSRYLKHINNEEHPYGENVIVAIMCYNGYNVEDSILFNEGSVKRGLFRTTYYNMYETFEESSKIGSSTNDIKIGNIHDSNVIGLKAGSDYSKLDEYGIIKENTMIDDKTVVIGKMTSNLEQPDSFIDSSIFTKKGQMGFVDKSFITDGEEGFRIAKVRVRDERIPNIGDKFCSRCGQKGTIGLLIPEENMPFTSDGIRPDIIINPHALPSRMTIGQLIETVMGKTCLNYGGFGDCTAFMNKGSKINLFGNALQNVGLQSKGEQMLYNGETGLQLQTNIYIGPTYYMRLKHMVKDKINYRARGPRTVLTRQTVQGRANDGGLRVGEMERDGVLAHGASLFLKESMMDRGDDYSMAVCNHTGMIAVYNENKNIFMSPMADGPIKFKGELDNLQIDKMTKYGKSFSIVRVPYSFKLLLQELMTMNIQMRIITEDNIDQLQSMSFSDNIIKLTDLLEPNEVLKAAKDKMNPDLVADEQPDDEEPDEQPDEEPDEEEEPVENFASKTSKQLMEQVKGTFDSLTNRTQNDSKELIDSTNEIGSNVTKTSEEILESVNKVGEGNVKAISDLTENTNKQIEKINEDSMNQLQDLKEKTESNVTNISEQVNDTLDKSKNDLTNSANEIVDSTNKIVDSTNKSITDLGTQTLGIKDKLYDQVTDFSESIPGSLLFPEEKPEEKPEENLDSSVKKIDLE